MPKIGLELGEAVTTDVKADNGVISYKMTVPVTNKGNRPTRYRVDFSSKMTDYTKRSTSHRGFIRAGQTVKVTESFGHKIKPGTDVHTVRVYSGLFPRVNLTTEATKNYGVEVDMTIARLVEAPTGFAQALLIRYQGDPPPVDSRRF